jgi:hypothetical protein
LIAVVLAGLALLAGGIAILMHVNSQSQIEEKNVYDPSYTPGRVVDHRDVARIEEFLKRNPDVVRAVEETNWFFAHATIGENMMDGMEDLHAGNAQIYPLTIQTIKHPAEVPGSLQSGVIYEVNRGNQSADVKREMFTDYMGKGWNRNVTAVMNKFNYTDHPYVDSKLDWNGNRELAGEGYTIEGNKIDGYAKNYTYTMGTIQQNNPDLQVVFTTIPLTAKDERGNLMRYFANEYIRNYCAENGYLLFDIADIQSHYPDGTPNRGFHNDSGSPYEMLLSEYTTDGGHLNTDGKRILARGWYAMAARVAVMDDNG